MILTIDLGTSTTKAVLWDTKMGAIGPAAIGPAAIGRGAVPTDYPQPGWAEQDAEDWWRSVVSACDSARAVAGAAWSRIEAVVFAAARETIVPVDVDGSALRSGVLWSDRRAGAEAKARCAGAGGAEMLRSKTGVVFDAGTTAAKADWLATHSSDVMTRARWLMAPRDVVVMRMTGIAATDFTLASRTGWYGLDGVAVDDAPVALLPDVRPSNSVIGELRAQPATLLGLPLGVPVVLGAGDRACEVLGSGADGSRPMVSWGTTANVSLPSGSMLSTGALPAGVAMSAGALGGHLLECGLSSAGEALDWLAGLSGRSSAELLGAAADVPPGARGAVATCWFNGARAPWWEAAGRAAFVGLTPAHQAGDLARAIVEAVAFDVVRSLEALGGSWTTLCAAGGGGGGDLWPRMLGGVTGCVVERRQTELAASAGALLVGCAALGRSVELDAVNPIVDTVTPDAQWVEAYRGLRPKMDRVAGCVLEAGR